MNECLFVFVWNVTDFQNHVEELLKEDGSQRTHTSISIHRSISSVGRHGRPSPPLLIHFVLCSQGSTVQLRTVGVKMSSILDTDYFLRYRVQ
jgi:hypothetical protein